MGQLKIGDRSVSRRVLMLMTIGFVGLLIAGGAAIWIVNANQRHAERVAHTFRVETKLTELQALVERAETARRGLLLHDDDAYRQTLATTLGSLQPAALELARITGDNPRQAEDARELVRLTGLQRDLVDTTVALIDTGGRELAVEQFRAEDAGLRIIRRLRAVSTRMIAVEEGLLAQREAQQARSVMMFFVVGGVTATLLVVMAIASLLVMRRYASALARSRDELEALNTGLEAAVQERTRDLSRANEEIQRFAYIVSHDLRSPLVNVMGFTSELEAAARPLAAFVDKIEAEAPELFDREAALAAREDLPEAASFIRSSTQKMDRLINAILQLSRQGRRTLAPESVDVDALVDGIRDSMAHRIDEIGATLTVDKPLPVVISDRLAIEQILSNLIENAIKYREPTRPLEVAVTGQRQGSRVTYSVIDNGRGVDPRDHQRIFDLFRRSGAQTEPGEGIGLAHVRALAYRLGGTIDCQSELGQGATFRLMLPATFAGELGQQQ